MRLAISDVAHYHDFRPSQHEVAVEGQPFRPAAATSPSPKGTFMCIDDQQPPPLQAHRGSPCTRSASGRASHATCHAPENAATAAMRSFLFAACAAFIASVAHGQSVDPPKAWMACAACHAADGSGGVGPSLRGVLGRKSGAVPGFGYSRAMKSASIAWEEESLTAFLSDPQKTVPGNRMFSAGVSDPGDVAELVRYLKTLR